MWYVYIGEKREKLYTGITIDLKDRMRQHKTVVLYSEIYESKFDAARRDKGVESGEKGNPD